MSQSSTRSPASSAGEPGKTPITGVPTDARPSRTPHFVSMVGLWSVMWKALRCVAAGCGLCPPSSVIFARGSRASRHAPTERGRAARRPRLFTTPLEAPMRKQPAGPRWYRTRTKCARTVCPEHVNHIRDANESAMAMPEEDRPRLLTGTPRPRARARRLALASAPAVLRWAIPAGLPVPWLSNKL